MADQNVLLNTITNSHNFNFTNIVYPRLLGTHSIQIGKTILILVQSLLVEILIAHLALEIPLLS